MSYRYPIIAESNGHRWIKFYGLVCCRDCGIVRRADDNNKPCRGKVKITLRDEILPAATAVK